VEREEWEAERLSRARSEVEEFARAKRARIVDESDGRWRVERKPAFFKLGWYYWDAEMQGDGSVSFSERQWRPDPRYG
jgi:hypothetical protein